MRHFGSILFAGLLLSGCASARARRHPPVAPPSPEVEAEQPLDASTYLRLAAEKQLRAVQERKVNPCKAPAEPDAAMIDTVHEGLYRTLCGAALWFDGLFGEEQHPAAAANTHGRLELSTLYTERDGAKIRSRLNVSLRLPNMENRVEAFFGRDNDQEFVQGRSEGLALRSQFVNLESEDHWVAGLGYGVPGSYKQKTDFRVGVRGGLRTPETFAQGRYRHNWFIGDHDLWHFREIVFWTNRDGFGATTAVDFDRVLSQTRVFRWANIATNSQATHAWSWRTALVLYRNLLDRQAIAYETFVRGETGAQTAVGEYGLRTVYRRGMASRPWLYGEFVLGYSWIRWRNDEPRDGSAAVGVGVEILIGRE